MSNANAKRICPTCGTSSASRWAHFTLNNQLTVEAACIHGGLRLDDASRSRLYAIACRSCKDAADRLDKFLLDADAIDTQQHAHDNRIMHDARRGENNVKTRVVVAPFDASDVLLTTLQTFGRVLVKASKRSTKGAACLDVLRALKRRHNIPTLIDG